MSAAEPDDEDAELSDEWVPYFGPEGGTGWIRPSDDRVSYEDDPPGEVAAGAEELFELEYDELMDVGRDVFGDSFDAIEDSPQVEGEDSLRATLIDIVDRGEQRQEMLEAADQIANPFSGDMDRPEVKEIFEEISDTVSDEEFRSVLKDVYDFDTYMMVYDNDVQAEWAASFTDGPAIVSAVIAEEDLDPEPYFDELEEGDVDVAEVARKVTQQDEDEEVESDDDPSGEYGYGDEYEPESGEVDYDDMEWVQRAFSDEQEYSIDREEISERFEEMRANNSDKYAAQDLVAEYWGEDVDPADVFRVVDDGIKRLSGKLTQRIKKEADVGGTFEVNGAEVEIDLSDRHDSKRGIRKATTKSFTEAYPEAAEQLEMDLVGDDDPLQMAFSAWSGKPLREKNALLWSYMRDETGYDNIPLDVVDDLDAEDIDPETVREKYGDDVFENVEKFMDHHRDVLREVFGESIPVFRGGNSDPVKEFASSRRDDREESAEFEHMSGASWTVDPLVSYRFMSRHRGAMFVQNVTPDDVFASTFTATGFDRESELVVSGGNPEYDFVSSAKEFGDNAAITSADMRDNEEQIKEDLFSLMWERFRTIEKRMQERSVE